MTRTKYPQAARYAPDSRIPRKPTIAAALRITVSKEVRRPKLNLPEIDAHEPESESV
jgi:hypothetical protein